MQPLPHHSIAGLRWTVAPLVLLALCAPAAVRAQTGVPPVAVPETATVLPPVLAPDVAVPPGLLLGKEEPAPVEDPTKVRSLFFSADEITQIRLALSAYIKNTSGKGQLTVDEEAFLKQLTGLVKDQKADSAAAPQEFTYPQFYLASLVYHGESNWLVVVAGRKFTPSTAQNASDLRIVFVTEDKVEIEWKPDPIALQKVKEAWAIGANDTAEVDLRHGIVTFSLRTNQTFSSYAMRVLEGKQAPVTIASKDIKGGIVIPDNIEETTDGTEQQGQATSDKDEKLKKLGEEETEGLGGLIGAYKRVGGEEEKP